MASLKGFTKVSNETDAWAEAWLCETLVRLNLLCELAVGLNVIHFWSINMSSLGCCEVQLWLIIKALYTFFAVASLNPERKTIIKKKNLISFLLFEQSHNFVFYLFLSFYFLKIPFFYSL